MNNIWPGEHLEDPNMHGVCVQDVMVKLDLNENRAYEDYGRKDGIRNPN